MTGHQDHVPPGDPAYDGFRITELWAFCQIDPTDNQEGLISMQTMGGHMPLICADRRRMVDLRPVAQALATEIGRSVLLKHFILTEGGEVIDP